MGSYTGSPSPFGTFDQGGNVSEWNETAHGPERGVRGGAYDSLPGGARSAVTSLSPATTTSGHPTHGSETPGWAPQGDPAEDRKRIPAGRAERAPA